MLAGWLAGWWRYLSIYLCAFLFSFPNTTDRTGANRSEAKRIMFWRRTPSSNTAAADGDTIAAPFSRAPLHAEVWGPHYWFFLHTVAFTYPDFPTVVTRRKYYDLITNMPLFIPVPEMGNDFAQLLDKHPIAPYLDNRESLMRWVHFVHNKYNVAFSRPPVPFHEAVHAYLANYTPPVVSSHFDRKYTARVLYAVFATSILLALVWSQLYAKK